MFVVQLPDQATFAVRGVCPVRHPANTRCWMRSTQPSSTPCVLKGVERQRGRGAMQIPQNQKLLAVPLFDLYDKPQVRHPAAWLLVWVRASSKTYGIRMPHPPAAPQRIFRAVGLLCAEARSGLLLSAQRARPPHCDCGDDTYTPQPSRLQRRC
jgi:hypothetical protein